MKSWRTCLLLILAPLSAFGQDKASPTPAPGHWPQWRGPNRDNLSTETGLLKEWPEGGPKLLWKVTEFGDGIPPVSVAGGRIYGLGYREGKEFVTALNGAGAVVWSQSVGPQTGEMPGMRFLSQRPITVDDVLLYACTASGRVLCLRAADGGLLWEKELIRDFGGRAASFFFSDAPLVDGKNLICKPGGAKGTVLALDKLSGDVCWRSEDLKDPAGHAPLIAAEIGGVRQYVVLTHEHVAGIAAQDGKILWLAKRSGYTAVPTTPVYRDGIVFVSSGFGIGCNAFRVMAVGGQFKVEEVYSGKQMQNHRGGLLVVGDYLYGSDEGVLKCIELKTGTVLWQDRSVGKGSLTYADGHLVVLGEGGAVALVEANPTAYKEKGRFPLPVKPRDPILHPVLAGGRLYLRDVTVLYCYDLRGPEYKEPGSVWKVAGPEPPRGRSAGEPRLGEEKGPDAAFVPTPQDVVEKMIEAAKITKDDVVYDLGSGDGRIVITASRNHGCKSVGFEINPGLVWESRFKAKQQKLDDLVTIEEKDLFTVDLAPASVVMLYLGAPNNARLLPQLKKLKPGTRIVSHAHLLGDAGPKPDKEIRMTSQEDGVEHAIYVWTAPLKKKE